MTYQSAYDNDQKNFDTSDLHQFQNSVGDRVQNVLGRRLTRSSANNWLGGVLSGIGETYGFNIALLRLLFVAVMLLPGPQLLILVYLAAWVIMPTR